MTGVQDTVRASSPAVLPSTGVWQLVEDRAASTPAAEFAVDEHGRRFGFGEFHRFAENVAGRLYEHGVRAGDVVSWQLPNTVEAMAVSMALARLGAVQNPLIPMLREPDVEFIVTQVKSSLLIVPHEFRGYGHGEMAQRLSERVPGLGVLVLDDGWAAGDPATLPAVAAAEADAVGWIFYTSGTTSEPKGVQHTDSGLIAAAKTFVTNLEVGPDDRCAAYVPIAHVGGVAHVLHSLLVGHSLIVSAVFDPERNADQLIAERATLVGSGLPFTNEYLRISAERGIAPLFPQARATLGGGSGRPASLHAAARDRLGGVGIISGYGMTECPYITWGTPGDTDLQHAEFEGIPGEGGQVRIIGDDGRAADPGEVGEIRVRGPQLFRGYVDTSLNEGAFDADGFFRSGDLGYLDADGRLAVTGRIKEVIVRKMENISAREVEEAMIGDPMIADLTVIGVPDPVSGERVCAVTVPADPGRPPTLESVREFLRTTALNIRKFPEQVETVDEIPRNSLGKVAKVALRRRFTRPENTEQDRPGAADRGDTDFDTVEFEVSEHIATITLNRPDRLNCFNETMAREMATIWARVRDDDDIHVAVLRANGDRAFCTGVDLSGGAWWTHINKWNQEDPGVLLGPRHHLVWKPVICAVHGMVAGGAMYFLNECDIVICSEDATFFDPHANGGMVSSLEPIGMLARGVSFGEVMRWALLGSDERMTAATALRAGIVTEITPAPELRQRAHQLATEIAGRRPDAVQGTVRALWEALEMSPSIAKRNGLSYTQIGNPGEGRTDARKNKREPRFR